MSQQAEPRYVRLRHDDGFFVISLFDKNKMEIGFGYKGPTQKRADGDLKYWKKKGLEELPE